MQSNRLFFLFFLLLPLTIVAQDGAVSKITGTSSFSLAADWNQDYHIVFSQSNLSTGYLYCIQKNSSLCYKIEMAPYLRVCDMKVKDDTLFFVGYHNNTRRGMWGFVALSDFSGSEVMVCCHTANTMAVGYLNEGVEGPEDPFSFVNFSKMEILANGSSRTRIVAIGERRRLLPGESSLYDSKRCLFLLDPYDSQSFVYSRNESTNEYYDDLSVVGGNLVCSYRNDHTTLSSVNSYGYRIFSNPDSLFNSHQSGYFYTYEDAKSASALLLSSTDRGEWASVHYRDMDGLGRYGIVVEYYHIESYSSPVNFRMTKRHKLPCNLSAVDKLRDVVYSPATSSLLVLADITTPLFATGHSVVFRFLTARNTGYSCPARAYLSASNTLFSLSPSGDQKLIVSGKKSSSLLLVWDSIVNSAACLQTESIDSENQNGIEFRKERSPLSLSTGTSTTERYERMKSISNVTILCQ